MKCADGYPNILDCEPGLAYDDRIRKCNWPDELQEICKPEGKNYLCHYIEIMKVILPYIMFDVTYVHTYICKKSIVIVLIS